MPATPQPENDAHQQLLDQMDIYYLQKRFRSSDWKPSQRRNKNIKQILSEAQRKEASVLATQNNSGASTPVPASDGTLTPQPNMSQATQSLSTLVLERNLQKTTGANGAVLGGALGIPGLGPAVTYNNIESAPSLHAAKKHYCDITGLPASYTDPKTKLRYYNQEIFGVVRTLPPGGPDQYLAARGANIQAPGERNFSYSAYDSRPEMVKSMLGQQSQASPTHQTRFHVGFKEMLRLNRGLSIWFVLRHVDSLPKHHKRIESVTRIKAAVDSRIAEEQARQSKQQQATRQTPRRRPQNQNDATLRRPSAVRGTSSAGAEKGSNPDPSEFEPEFAIGTDESTVPSRVATPKPEPKESETNKDQSNKEASPTEPQVTPEKSAREPAEDDLSSPGKNVAAQVEAPELPEDVKAKLRKLEKLESKYGELLKAYRIAHARVQRIEPFEASLRENTPLTSISDPGALVEYLNQLNLKGDMVLDELKRVSADRDDYKKKQIQSEAESQKLQAELDDLKVKMQAASASVEEQVQDDSADTPATAHSATTIEPEPEIVKSPASTSSRIPSISLFSPKVKARSPPPKEDTEDLFSYDSELPRLESELKESQIQIETLTKHVNSLKGDLKVARESTESMVQTLESATRELHTLRDVKDKFEQSEADLKKQITELESKASTETSEANVLRQQITALESQKVEMATAQAEIESQLISLEQSRAELEKQLKDATDATNILNEKLAQKDHVTKDLEDSLAMARVSEREQVKEIENAKSSHQRVATMQGVLDNLRSQLTDAETTVADLKRDALAQRMEFTQRPSSKIFGILDEDEKLASKIEGLSSRTDIVKYLAECFDLNSDNNQSSGKAVNGTSTTPSEAPSSGPAKKKANKKKKKNKGPQSAVEDATPDVPVKVSEDLSLEHDEGEHNASVLNKQIAELEEQITQLKNELSEKGASVERLSARIKDQESLQEEIETLRDDLLHQGEEHVEARDLLKVADNERKALRENVEKLERDLLETRKQLTANAESEQAHNRLLKEFEGLKTKSATMQTDLSAAESLATARFKDITDLREVLGKAQPELRSLKKEVEELKSAKEDLKNKSGELSRLESKHEEIKAEMKNLGRRLSEKDSEVKDLQQKVEQETRARERVERDLTSAQSEIRSGEASRRTLAETSEQTAKDLSNAKEEALSLRGKIRDMEEQITGQSRQISSLKEEVSIKQALHASSQSLVQSLRDQTHELSVQTREAASRVENLEEELSEAQRMLSERTREGQTMRMLLDQAEAGTEARIREMKERMEAAIEERDRIEDEASVASRRMMREVDDAKNKARDAQRALKSLEDEKDELENRIRDWKRRRDELEASAETAAKEVEDVRAAMKGLREALDESERQIRDVETHKADLRRQTDEANERIEKLNKANKNLTEEIKSFQTQAGFSMRKGSTRPTATMDSGLQSSRTSIDSSSARSPAPISRISTATPRSETPNTGTGLSQGSVDYVYLKNVLLQFLSQKDKSHQRQLIPVLGMLLHFDQKDEQKWSAAISAR